LADIGAASHAAAMTALAIAPVRQHDGMLQREFITVLHTAQTSPE
jgi:hypothetical protein